MREIKRIFVHATATPRTHTVEQILRFFRDVRKWHAPGYHYIIEASGRVHNVYPVEKVANGVKGYNATSVHVAWIGGIDANGKGIDNRTEDQIKSLRKVISVLHSRYPKAEILGHRDISPDLNGNGIVDSWERIKECPCFDAKKEYADIQ